MLYHTHRNIITGALSRRKQPTNAHECPRWVVECLEDNLCYQEVKMKSGRVHSVLHVEWAGFSVVHEI